MGEWRRHPAFASPPVPDALSIRASAAGWPAGLVERAVRLHIDRAAIEQWLDDGFPPPAQIDKWLDAQELLTNGTLRMREATWADHDLLVDLFDHSPETVGDWTVTVERSPYPYAQFRLQEHPHVQLLEDQRVGLGVMVRSGRNALVAGREVTVTVVSAWRVREGLRGLGFSNLLLSGPGPGMSWFGLLTYWYGRKDNASRPWLDKVAAGMSDGPLEWSAEVKGLSATVHSLVDLAAGRVDRRVRPATPQDLVACVALINRTHAGLDLFRPYGEEFLRLRLDDPSWGPKPHFWTPVYGWEDFHVLEEGGRIVACAGLWDRGAHVRERWQRPDGEQRILDPAGLLDFGYAEGRDDAMADLIGHLAARSAGKGRSGLLAPLEFLPDVLDRCQCYRPVPETRSLEVWPFTSPTLKIDLSVTRPYTDLAYW